VFYNVNHLKSYANLAKKFSKTDFCFFFFSTFWGPFAFRSLHNTMFFIHVQKKTYVGHCG
jgi:hypothetical protein